MKVGDKRQATALSLVAIGAIGFLIYSIIPQAAKAVRAAGAKPAVETGEVQVVNLVLNHDPFYHPLLKAHLQAENDSVKADTNEEPTPKPLSGRLGEQDLGPLPAASIGPYEPDASYRPGAKESPSGDHSKPTSSTGPDKAKPIMLTLQGTMKIDRASAIIALGDGDGKAYSIGDIVLPGVRLVGVGDQLAEISYHGKKIRLTLGTGCPL